MSTVQSLVQYVDKKWIQSRLWPAKSLTAFQSSVHTNNDVEGWHNRLNRQTCTGKLDLAPILYKEATFVMVQSVLVSEEHLFHYQHSAPDVPRCAGPSAGVLALLQGQRTDDVAAALPLRPSDGSCTALNRTEHLTYIIDDAV